MNEKIKQELDASGYDWALAQATAAEINSGAACGMLAIISEQQK